MWYSRRRFALTLLVVAAPILLNCSRASALQVTIGTTGRLTVVDNDQNDGDPNLGSIFVDSPGTDWSISGFVSEELIGRKLKLSFHGVNITESGNNAVIHETIQVSTSDFNPGLIRHGGIAIGTASLEGSFKDVFGGVVDPNNFFDASPTVNGQPGWTSIRVAPLDFQTGRQTVHPYPVINSLGATLEFQIGPNDGIELPNSFITDVTVPEPRPWLMLGSGLVGLLVYGSRRGRKRSKADATRS